MDDEIDIKYQVLEIGDTSKSDGGHNRIKQNPENYVFINSEQKELNDLFTNLAQCGSDCETCQEYIRKLSEHVRATHPAGQPTRDRDPLHIDTPYTDQASATEIKCDVEETESMDFQPDTEFNIETGSANYRLADQGIFEDHVISGIISEPHISKKKFPCNECGKSYTRKTHLNTHMTIHTGDKLSNCERCGKSFTTSAQLTVHLRTHTGEKPFKCEECAKCFTTKSDLTVHVRTHTGEKPFHCTVCEKCFTTNAQLTIHVRSHTGERPYHCEQCGKGFTAKGKLSIHLRCHTGEKPYNCEECGKGFPTSSKLSIHKRCHSGIKPYKCDVCDKSFKRSDNLLSHKIVHNRN